jgi:PAS domain S-box-containing protein
MAYRSRMVAESPEEEIRALREENRRLVAMLDALPEHLLIQDRDARIVFANRGSAELASAVLGRPREDLVGFSVLDGQQPEHFKRYAIDLVARACRGETFTEEFVLPDPREGPRWRETTIAPVYGRDGEVELVAMVSRDIHARKQAEARLLLLTKIGALVGTSSAGALAALPAAAIPELGDLAILDVIEDGQRITAGQGDVAAASSTIEVPIDVLGKTIARATFAFTESGRRHEPADRVIAHEVARRVAQIVENARLHEEVSQALVYRERVMGILGHDLRNPLAAVLSLSQMLGRRADVPERTKEGLGHIERSAQRMEQMIHTILDFTQLRFRGAPPLTREAFALDKLAQTIVDELRIARPGRTITISTHGDVRGRWDFTRMGQVISNLVGNALTHGASDSPVTVEVAADGAGVRLSVANRGATIPPSTLDKLFEPFWQASAENPSRGLGLGLFITQQIVHAHGGAIDVQSQDEHTTFTVHLPRE